MATVITPDALEKSGFRKMTLEDFHSQDGGWDELCVFKYPSPNAVDQVNGDGQLLQVWDFARDLSWISVEGREVAATSETEIWVR
jgi:hypothetical protein